MQMCSRPPCFAEPYQDKWRPLDGSCPFGSLLQAVHSHSKHTHACMYDQGERERRGSTPGRSHPRQITICTRHLRAELSGWRENKRTENGERAGGMRPAAVWSLSGLLVWLPELLYTPQRLVSCAKYGCKNTANQNCPLN